MTYVVIIKNKEIKERLKNILLKLNLPIENNAISSEVYRYALKDKKASKNSVTIVQVNTIGTAELIEISLDELKELC